MKTISYVVDPEGDVELVLSNPNSHQIIPKFHPPHTNLPDSDFDNPPATGRYTIFNELYTKQTTSTDPQDAEEIPEPCEVRMRISSEQMSGASITFSHLLESANKVASPSSSSSSSLPPSSDPLHEMHTDGWDAMALAIFMDNIHGLQANPPQVINLGLLVRITTVVEYCKCEEVMIHPALDWRREILSRESIPNDFCQKTLLWLYFFWVIPWQRTLFTDMAGRVLRVFKGPAEVNLRMLPLKPLLFDDKRVQLIGQIKLGLDNLHNTLSTEQVCAAGNSYGCPALTLGALIQMVRGAENDRGSPLIPPFHMWSVSQVIRMVHQWPELLPFHEVNERFGSKFVDANNGRMHPCSIKGRMLLVFDGVERTIEGLRYGQFQV